jgi:hypothetical protein
MHSKGNTIPVDALPPNTIAMIVTFIISIPFIPAFERPIIKADNAMRNQLSTDSSNNTSIITV